MKMNKEKVGEVLCWVFAFGVLAFESWVVIITR